MRNIIKPAPTPTPVLRRIQRLQDARTILGVRIDRTTVQGAVQLIDHMVNEGGRHVVIPVNPEMIVAAQKDPYFRDTINGASLSLPDGVGVVLASWIFGRGIPERVTGIDTVFEIAALAEARGFRIFLLGAAEGVADDAARRLQERHPRLIIAGTYSGSPDPSEEEEICRLINESGAHILLIAYGAPKQEFWIARNRRNLNAPVAMCVGGTFDFIAGLVPRAPRWMRSLGLEWAYRLMNQPSRWRRMLALPRFAGAIVRKAFSLR